MTLTAADKVLQAISMMPGCTSPDLQALTGIPAEKVHQIIQNSRRIGAITGKRDGGRVRWWMTVDYSAYRINPALIIDVLKKSGGEVQGKLIAKSLGVSGYKIRHRMGELLQAGIVGKRTDSHGAVFWRLLVDGDVPQYTDRPPVSGPQAHSFLRSVRWTPAKSMTEFLSSMNGREVTAAVCAEK